MTSNLASSTGCSSSGRIALASTRDRGRIQAWLARQQGASTTVRGITPPADSSALGGRIEARCNSVRLELPGSQSASLIRCEERQHESGALSRTSARPAKRSSERGFRDMQDILPYLAVIPEIRRWLPRAVLHVLYVECCPPSLPRFGQLRRLPIGRSGRPRMLISSLLGKHLYPDRAGPRTAHPSRARGSLLAHAT